MIVGQDKAIEAFMSAWRGGTPHHAWLLAGPRGVGKASFAAAAARRILAQSVDDAVTGAGFDIGDDHQAAHLLAAGSHPDFRRLERVMNKSGTALARNISVGQVRDLAPLFSVTSSLGDWRVVVIDAADDLEASAANALLKMLEEPPAKTIFLLVAHAPGRLLPTIRSRCRTLEFPRLSDEAMGQILLRQRPDDSGEQRAELVALGQGSAGRAIAIAEQDLAALARQATAIMREGDPTTARRAALAKALATKKMADRYASFLAMLPALVASEARRAEGGRREALLDAYDEARKSAVLAPRLSADPASTVYVLAGHLAAAADRG